MKTFTTLLLLLDISEINRICKNLTKDVSNKVVSIYFKVIQKKGELAKIVQSIVIAFSYFPSLDFTPRIYNYITTGKDNKMIIINDQIISPILPQS